MRRAEAEMQVEESVQAAMAPPPPRHSSGGDTVRRSSPFASPASRGVAGLQVASRSTRETTPRRVSYESLLGRPRSNQRTRTPMRYESPLSASAFRLGEDDASPSPREGQRVTVRPLAGLAVGTVRATRRVHEEGTERPSTPLSSKQGPSHRKIRRWNNDNFVGVASEIANASSRGPAIAQLLLQAKADAPKYLPVFDPSNSARSPELTSFLNDESMKHLREEFFEGKIGNDFTGVVRHGAKRDSNRNVPLTPEVMLKRIHERLRKVVVRACSNSAESKRIVSSFERFLVRCFQDGKDPKLAPEVMKSLVEPPTITRRKSGQVIARFYFDSQSTTGGFHRLLLHAVAQFHGLNVVSTTIKLESRGHAMTSRLLAVAGTLTGSEFRVADYVTESISGTTAIGSVSNAPVTEALSALTL